MARKRTVRAKIRATAKKVASLIPSKYIPAKVRRDPKTGKIKLAIQPSKLKKSTRTRRTKRRR